MAYSSTVFSLLLPKSDSQENTICSSLKKFPKSDNFLNESVQDISVSGVGSIHDHLRVPSIILGIVINKCQLFDCWLVTEQNNVK
jgi:hypothetical protein